MSARTLVVLLSTLPTGLCACGSKDPGGAGDETTGGESSSGETTTGETGDASGDSDSESDTGPTEVTYSGVVQDFYSLDPEMPIPIPGAEISLVDMPGFETVSDGEGKWTIAGLSPNSTVMVKIEDSTDYWGSVIPLDVGDVDRDDVELAQVSVEAVEIQEMALQMQDPNVMADPAKAVFLAGVLQNTATGTTVTLDPMPPAGSYYAPDENGQPTLDLNVASWFLYPVVVFLNLDPGPADAYTMSAAHPERDCTVLHPSQPSFARHINLFEIDCPPMG